MKLVVTHAFASYSIGDEITDAETIKTILDGDQAQFVVKVAAPEATQEKPGRAGK